MKKEPDQLGTRIGRGREAEIFYLNHEWVVKLFYNRTAQQIKNEVQINQLIYKAGLPVPAAIKSFEIDGQLGIVFERLPGKTMLAEMVTKPWKIFRYAKQLAGFHSIIHKRNIEGLPGQRLQLIEQIQSAEPVSEEIKILALGILNSIPKEEQLCHGDYHPDNLIMTGNNLKIIDWTVASAGNPIADLALTSVLLQLGRLPPDTSLFTRWAVIMGRKLFHRYYLSHYLKLNPGHKNEYKKWLLPVAIGRLNEGIVEEQDRLLAFIEKSYEENNR
ncbi:aminoglycoside phosphotransferase family protein [Eudoraea sp.]|uniref:aminoglycoside phosphotransferase family protein n=1 Tax=Eudoraea sp. TaxID=1979955 RepID=UPI003C720B1F